MVTITIYKNQEGSYLGFESSGHAEFADYGDDIVCAGISALTVNTVNSIAYFTKDVFTTDSDEEQGRIVLRLQEPASPDCELLLKSLVLGLQGIQNSYGNEYISLKFKEV